MHNIEVFKKKKKVLLANAEMQNTNIVLLYCICIIVSSEAMDTIKLFVDNHSGSDTSTVSHETMDTAADTACHRLPELSGTTFA